MTYENCKIYGPYLRKDGRKHIIAIFSDGLRKTVSYPKYLMEVKLNKYLEDNETVDHINMDISNDGENNLRILERQEHIKLDVRRYKPKKFRCPYCNKQFSLSGHKLHDAIQNRKRNRAGPFCSRSCAGKYGRDIQDGKIRPLEIKHVKPEHTNNKHLQSLHREICEVDIAKTGKL